MKQKLLRAIVIENLTFYDAPINEIKVKMYANELEESGHSIDDIKKAFSEFRKEKGRRQMPMPADVIEKLNSFDGRPGVEQAWATIPRNEYQSTFWTEETRIAYGKAYPLIKEGDRVAARMTFKEVYEKLVNENRQKQMPAKWTPSFGTDQSSRETAVIEAVQEKRISISSAIQWCPELPQKYEQHPALIAESNEIKKLESKENEIKEIIEKLTERIDRV